MDELAVGNIPNVISYMRDQYAEAEQRGTDLSHVSWESACVLHPTLSKARDTLGAVSILAVIQTLHEHVIPNLAPGSRNAKLNCQDPVSWLLVALRDLLGHQANLGMCA
ncbi:hypothetical protein LZ30DRAFT_293794 [Colletotrichum cereale]|nr:hypothetical protein LZ30DRAFT_293794 [Colletotrichum cereale]